MFIIIINIKKTLNIDIIIYYYNFNRIFIIFYTQCPSVVSARRPIWTFFKNFDNMCSMCSLNDVVNFDSVIFGRAFKKNVKKVFFKKKTTKF